MGLRKSVSLAAALMTMVGVAEAQMQSSYSADRSPMLAGFGGSVAISGGDIIVAEGGNVFRPGMIYVYRKSGGQWTETAALSAANGAMADRFGGQIAVDGNTMLATIDPRGDDGERRVLVFTRSASGDWRETGHLPHHSMEGHDEQFGASIAIAGDLAYAGVPEHGDSAGAVHIYRRSGDSWEDAGHLTLEDSEGARFGSSIAVSGGHVIIGASGGNDGAGSFYHFHNTGSEHVNMGEISLPNVDAGNQGPRRRFGGGGGLAMNGNTLYVGRPGAMNVGAVAVMEFDSEAGEFALQQMLMPYQAGRRGARFGSAIAVGDRDLWISAPAAGGVFTYEMDENGVSGVSMIEASGSPFGSGASASISGDLAVMGNGSAEGGSGEARVYERTSMGWTEVAVLNSDPEALASITGDQVRCDEGQAEMWGCDQIDLVSFLPVSEIGGGPGISLNDMWGWYDEATRREFAIVGRTDGTSFIEVTDPSNPRYLGNLQHTEGATPSVWRDMKVYNDFVFIVADGAGQHGMQVFDLKRLRSIDEPREFDMDFYYDNIASAHNIVLNEETGFAYIVGARGGGETCGGGLHMVDVRDPMNPTFAGCSADGVTGRAGTGYSHDAQCITYHGPDQDYQGREICVGNNETALSFADVTDKDNPVQIGSVSYPNVAYAHQGWFSDDHRFFFSNDEGDEPRGLVENTRTLVWDLSDLDDPILLDEYFATTTETDHNLYIIGNLMYQSNYGAGLRIVDISDPENLREVGYFDTDPDLGCCGSWSNYPYFRSGAVGVTGGRGGFFMVKKRDDLVP